MQRDGAASPLRPLIWPYVSRSCQGNCNRATATGFTLLELLVVIIMVGVLAALIAPGWLAFLNVRRLNVAQDRVYIAMRETQERARQRRQVWQASFREVNGTVQWAVHPAEAPPQESDWQEIGNFVQVDPASTTLYCHPSQGVWRARFDGRGHTNGRLGRLTLMPASGGAARRCVFVSTLLGALRRDRDTNCAR